MIARLLAPLAVLACVVAFFCGCAPKAGQPVLGVSAVPFLTKETGTLTIERQEFVNTWAATQVLYDAWLKSERATCASVCGVPARCAQLPEIEAQGKVIYVTVEAKLRNPEAEVDWDHIIKILSLIAKFVL